MKPEIKKQTALISGASSGIGAATARLLSENGFDLILLGRNNERLQKVKSECSSHVQIETLIFDLKDLNIHQDQLFKTVKNLSPLQLIVNNAGVYNYEAFEKTTEQTWQNQFEVNLLSAVKLTQLFWNHFIENKSGSIVNVSSTLGVKPISGTSAYSAIKAAMVNWTLTLAQEGGTHNIRANCVCPGLVDTPIHSFHHLPEAEKANIKNQMSSLQLLPRIGEPDDIAKAIVFLGTDQASWVTGSVLHVDGGINLK